MESPDGGEPADAEASPTDTQLNVAPGTEDEIVGRCGTRPGGRPPPLCSPHGTKSASQVLRSRTYAVLDRYGTWI